MKDSGGADDFTIDTGGADDTITLSRSVLAWLGVFVKDLKDPSKGFPNRYWTEFGHTLDMMGDGIWQNVIHPDDKGEVDRLVDETFRNPRHNGAARFRVRDSDGNWHWILTKGAVESFDDQNRPVRYIGVDHDVTEIAELEEELRAAQKSAEEQAFEAEALRTAGAVITSSLSRNDAAAQVAVHLSSVVDAETVIVFEASERCLHALDGSIVICEDAVVDDPPKDPYGFFGTNAGIEALYETQRRRAPDIVYESSEGERFWLLIPMVSRNNVLGVVAIGRRGETRFEGHEIRFAMAISDYMALALVNARLYEEMQKLATTDQLSGLLTRRAFFDRSESVIRDEKGTTEFAVLILDIDHFKRINDDFGHIVGDEAIRRVASVFQRNLREIDIVGRYGGEEFCALLPRASREESFSIAERICGIVRDLSIDGIDRKITVSIGVASSPAEAIESVSTLLDCADSALYTAKRSGRDQVRFAE